MKSVVLVLLNFLLGIVLSCEPIYNRNFRWMSCPTYHLHPTNESEIINIVNKARSENATVRAIGAGISWNAVAMVPTLNYNTKQNATTYLLNFTLMTGVMVDNISMTARIQAGATVLDVCKILESYGVALKEFGGPHLATFLGSVSTGTHGKGSAKNPIGTMARQITGLRLVVANGSVIVANETYNSDILNASQISFGALGIITEVTVRVSPLFFVTRDQIRIHDITGVEAAIKAIDDNIVGYTTNNDYIYGGLQTFHEYYNFQVMNITEKNFTNNTCWNEDESGYNKYPCTDVYYKSITPPVKSELDHGRNQEAEFYVPERVWVDAWKEMISWGYSLKNTELWNDTEAYFDLNHNITNGEGGTTGELQFNIRWIGPDETWLSPAYNETMVQIGIYIPGSYLTRVSDDIFNAWVIGYFKHLASNSSFHPVRVHWGKESLVGYCDIQGHYPKMEEFKMLRQQLDPDQMFLNDFARDKLGLCINESCCNTCCCTHSTCGFNGTYAGDEEDDDDDDDGAIFYQNYYWYIAIIAIINIFLN